MHVCCRYIEIRIPHKSSTGLQNLGNFQLDFTWDIATTSLNAQIKFNFATSSYVAKIFSRFQYCPSNDDVNDVIAICNMLITKENLRQFYFT